MVGPRRYAPNIGLFFLPPKKLYSCAKNYGKFKSAVRKTRFLFVGQEKIHLGKLKKCHLKKIIILKNLIRQKYSKNYGDSKSAIRNLVQIFVGPE